MILDNKSGDKFTKMLIAVIKGIRNQNTSIKDDEKVIFDNGDFMFKTPNRLPQLIYGNIQYEIIKKDNKPLTKGDKKILEDLDTAISNIGRIMVEIGDVLALEKYIKGKVITSVEIDDKKGISINYSDKPDKNDPNKKILSYSSNFLKNENFYEHFIIPDSSEIIKEENVKGQLSTVEFLSSGEKIDFELEDFSVGLTNRTLVTGGKNNIIDAIRVWEQDEETALISISSIIDKDYFDYSKTDFVYMNVESFYRVVKIREL